jgi:hypothetical protein
VTVQHLPHLIPFLFRPSEFQLQGIVFGWRGISQFVFKSIHRLLKTV